MDTVAVSEVWGVGRRIAKRLEPMGITTVGKLRAADPRRLREHFGVVLERTARELDGVPCLELEEMQPKKEIVASRAFGAPVFNQGELAESICEYMARAVRKLRRQNGVARVVGVWIQTNPFRPQDPQYQPHASVQLPVPTDDIADLTIAALRIMRVIYKPGFRYVKTGVMLSDLTDKGTIQGDLFFDRAQPSENIRDRLLDTMDRANLRWGAGTIGIGSAGMQQPKRWAMQRSNLTPAYTTRWSELARARAD
jgi:DNA polymerase V